MQRLLLIAGAACLLLLTHVPAASGQAEAWAFRTPGEAAYCRFFGGIECITPNDGFWIRISGIDEPRITKGYSERWRGFRRPSVRVLAFDAAWISSDAAVYTCVSRRFGLTCNHYKGLAFRLGRLRGYRVYRGPPGSVPQVDPFFRTTFGVWCGNAQTLVPEYLTLGCWRERDGTSVRLPHAQRKPPIEIRRNPHARDYRPSGFPLLRAGESFVLRCGRVTRTQADQCATRGSATVVLRCRAGTAALRCTNRFGRGLVLGPRLAYSI